MKLLPTLLVGSILATGPAGGLEFVPPNTLVLTEEELAMCTNGGCSLVPDKQVVELVNRKMKQAYNAGRASCNNFTEGK